MKINSQAAIKKWNWKFNIVIVLLFSFPLFMIGQTSEKKFAQEVPVNGKTTVITNVPSSLDIELNAFHYHRSNTKYGYIVFGKNTKERLFIHKEYKIHTWEKNKVRQEVEVKIKSESNTINNAFLSQLQIKLAQNKQGQISVDANMNLEKFTLNNGRLSGDDCQIILEDGTAFSVDYLKIKTSLYIPKTANLKVNSILNHTLLLDDLEGDLDLDIQYGEVYGSKIKNLNANLHFCYNVIFKEAENVNASATNSHLKIDKLKHLQIGEKKLRKTLLDKDETEQWMNNNSSMNLYNFREAKKIVISDTANDEFTIGEVDHLEIKSSIYSTYQILKVNNSFELHAKNSDISISEVAKDFDILNLNNRLCNMTINIADDGNYGINIFNIKTINYKLPSNAQPIEKESKEDAHFQMGKGKNTGVINIQCDKCELDIWD